MQAPHAAAFRFLRRIALSDFKSTQRTPLRHFQTTTRLRDAVAPKPLTRAPFPVPKPAQNPRKALTKPTYELTFTCKPCSTRSTHEVSKQGYHHGSVLISCPGCKNRHVISDHLKIFGETPMSLEDLIKDKGQLIKKGSLSEDGNFEVWTDGGTIERVEAAEEPAWKAAEQRVFEREAASKA